MIEIRVSYQSTNFEAADKRLYEAAGRISDFSGMDRDGNREHGFVVGSEFEAAKLVKDLKNRGFAAYKRTPTTNEAAGDGVADGGK